MSNYTRPKWSVRYYGEDVDGDCIFGMFDYEEEAVEFMENHPPQTHGWIHAEAQCVNSFTAMNEFCEDMEY